MTYLGAAAAWVEMPLLFSCCVFSSPISLSAATTAQNVLETLPAFTSPELRHQLLPTSAGVAVVYMDTKEISGIESHETIAGGEDLLSHV